MKSFFEHTVMIVSYVIAFLALFALMMGMSANGWEDDRSVPIVWVLSPNGGLLFAIVFYVFGSGAEKIKAKLVKQRNTQYNTH